MEASTVTNPQPPPTLSQKEQQYPEMIMRAIETLGDPNGSNKTAISKQIESTQPDLSPAHATLLSHHLNRMKATGQLIMVKNNYMKPDPNSPPRRGRGRPPKPKPELPPGTVLPPPRPRGRPPKPRDPFAPPPPPKTSSGGTGRPRGRPPKKAKTDSSESNAPTPQQPSGAPRGRGRPPKAKPAVTPVAG